MKVAVWTTKESGWTESDVRKAIETEEQQYQDALAMKKERAKRRTDVMVDGRRLWAEEMARRQRQLTRDCEVEAERLEREKRLLTDYVKFCQKKQVETVNQFRAQLDQQCVSINN